MKFEHYSIKQALGQPAQVFGSPENVVSDPRLDRQAKLQVLKKWLEDARADEKGKTDRMDSNGPSMLQRVEKSISRLIKPDND